MAQIPTGTLCIDNALGGGVPAGMVTLIYGEPETGKTTLAMQCAVHCALQNLKVLFVDCDNTFYPKRLAQISQNQFDQVAERIVLVKPKNFREQTAVTDNIQDYVSKNVGLIVIDTFTSLYSAETLPKSFSLNRELNRQLAGLAQLTKIRKIPIIITSQVRSVISEQSSEVRPVATRVLKFWADTIIALKPTEYPQTFKALIEKSPQSQVPVTCYIQIGEAGIQDAELH
jgi:RecA/RadA recombinase